jgi:CDP-4-dehydro-6-deoxyglucose reductase
MPLPPLFEARLVSARTLTPLVREVTFERVDGAPVAFEPGQWMGMLVPAGEGGVELRRSYSIASAPDGSPRFDVAVTRVEGGPGSTWLHQVEPGQTLRFIGPQGFFTRPAVGGPPALFVSTGTGVTPARSMARAALAAGSSAPMWFLLGVRHESDLLYADELGGLARENPSVRFEPTLSQPPAGWGGRTGYVQTHVRELWAELLAASASGAPPHVYVCGLERMVGSVREILRGELGLPRQQVHSERYD